MNSPTGTNWLILPLISSCDKNKTKTGRESQSKSSPSLLLYLEFTGIIPPMTSKSARTLVLACATVMEEMLPFLGKDMDHKILDFGLHVNPKELHRRLQDMIEKAGTEYGTIILGYGLCSLAVVGLRSNGCRLVIPRVDDCIGIFFGSRQAHMQQCLLEPGTYYLTRGWVEVGDTPFAEHERLVKKYGKEKAWKYYQALMGKYKRLAYIKTGSPETGKFLEYARETAQKYGLHFEELDGSPELVRKLLHGPWDAEIVVIEPGEICSLELFLPDANLER